MNNSLSPPEYTLHEIVTKKLIMDKANNKNVIQIRDNIFHIYESLNVFCTLIIGTESALLIDTGFGFGDIHSKVKQITDLPIQVINTHGHVDHIQGNKFFDEVMISEEDKPTLRLHSLLPVKVWIYLGARKRLTAYEKSCVSKFFKKNKQHNTVIKEGDVIELGGTSLEIIATPGHTRGSISLLDRKSRVLFSGDTISNHVWLFFKESTSINTYIETLKKLENQQDAFDAIIASHWPVPYKPTILQQLIHCAKHISVKKSTLFDTHLAGKALLYCEGFEIIEQKYGCKSVEDFMARLPKMDFNFLANSGFVSIAYAKRKLN